MLSRRGVPECDRSIGRGAVRGVDQTRIYWPRGHVSCGSNTRNLYEYSYYGMCRIEGAASGPCTRTRSLPRARPCLRRPPISCLAIPPAGPRFPSRSYSITARMAGNLRRQVKASQITCKTKEGQARSRVMGARTICTVYLMLAPFTGTSNRIGVLLPVVIVLASAPTRLTLLVPVFDSSLRSRTCSWRFSYLLLHVLVLVPAPTRTSTTCSYSHEYSYLLLLVRVSASTRNRVCYSYLTATCYPYLCFKSPSQGHSVSPLLRIPLVPASRYVSSTVDRARCGWWDCAPRIG